MEQRKKPKRLDRVPSQESPIDQNLGQVASELYDEIVLMDPNKIPVREYRIARTVDQRALETLAALPIETMLTEHNAGTHP